LFEIGADTKITRNLADAMRSDAAGPAWNLWRSYPNRRHNNPENHGIWVPKPVEMDLQTQIG
jgi:hypothetical protein